MTKTGANASLLTDERYAQPFRIAHVILIRKLFVMIKSTNKGLVVSVFYMYRKAGFDVTKELFM
jgi:hypothetical protein